MTAQCGEEYQGLVTDIENMSLLVLKPYIEHSFVQKFSGGNILRCKFHMRLWPRDKELFEANRHFAIRSSDTVCVETWEEVNEGIPFFRLVDIRYVTSKECLFPVKENQYLNLLINHPAAHIE